jgi:hypothetical protein
MKNLGKLVCRCVVLPLGLLALVQPAQAQFLVYNNSTNLVGGVENRFLPVWAGGVNHEVGDEILLSSPAGGPSAYMTGFDFEYFGLGNSGNETLQVRFYLNNGPGGAPGVKFFDSGLIDVSGPSWQTAKGTVVFGSSDLLSVALPSSFTWTVQFSGTTDPGESWGLYIYSPPTVGGNYTSYWNHDPLNGWVLSTDPTLPMDFGARVLGVPEPSSLGLGIAGGLLMLLLRARRKS